MPAYHNKPELKTLYVERAENQRKTDELVQGYGYWRNGKGCAIGWLAHVDYDSHNVLKNDAGFPASLNYLADAIFEGLPKGKFEVWPQRYAQAAKVGSDLTLITAHFMVWLLTEEITKNFDAEKFLDVAKSCKEIAILYQRKIAGEEIKDEEWADAARAACAASAAADAADAVRAACAAACAAARAPARAADSAADAVRAARAADAARAPARAACAASAACYERMAEKLIELMESQEGNYQ